MRCGRVWDCSKQFFLGSWKKRKEISAARLRLLRHPFGNERGTIIFSVLNGVLAGRMDNGPRGQAKGGEYVIYCGTVTTMPQYVVAYTINNLQLPETALKTPPIL
jgi:hypothetical protein